MCSEDDPVPSHNDLVLTISQITKYVLSLTVESKLVNLFTCAKEMIPLQQSLIKMVWPQLQSPIQTDNSTAESIINKRVQPKETKAMDMQFHWLCDCSINHNQFHFFW